MKKLNTLKKVSIVFILTLCFLNTKTLKGQMQVSSTDYYDNNSQLFSNDIGEAITTDLSGNYYTAGETALNAATQGIHIRKFKKSSPFLVTVNYNDSNYKEYVKKIVYVSSRIYVICNAVHKITGVSTLMVIRFNSSLIGTPVVSYFPGLNYHDPADAIAVSPSAIYIACKKRTGTSDELAAIQINSSLALIDSYSMFYSSLTDNIQENPSQLFYNTSEAALYVAGGCYNPVDSTTATLAIKLNGRLNASWVKKSAFSNLKNTYNSIAVTTNGVFVAGCRKSNGYSKWTLRRLNSLTGVTEITHTPSFGSGYSSEALKFTLGASNKLIVIGYAENKLTSKFDLKIANCDSMLSGTPVYYGEVLTPGSKINDGISKSNGVTYVTGQKIVPSAKNMFLYAFDNSGNLYFRDSINNNNSGGNRLAYNDVASSYLAVTGFKNNSGPLVLAEFSYTTRFYDDQINRNADVIAETGLEIFPNPCSDLISIRSLKSISNWVIYNMIGKAMLEHQLNSETLEESINVSCLPTGVYLLKLNNSETRKIIKN